jgi:hypothetical protein
MELGPRPGLCQAGEISSGSLPASISPTAHHAHRGDDHAMRGVFSGGVSIEKTIQLFRIEVIISAQHGIGLGGIPLANEAVGVSKQRGSLEKSAEIFQSPVGSANPVGGGVERG